MNCVWFWHYEIKYLYVNCIRHYQKSRLTCWLVDRRYTRRDGNAILQMVASCIQLHVCVPEWLSSNNKTEDALGGRILERHTQDLLFNDCEWHGEERVPPICFNNTLKWRRILYHATDSWECLLITLLLIHYTRFLLS